MHKVNTSLPKLMAGLAGVAHLGKVVLKSGKVETPGQVDSWNKIEVRLP